MSRINFRRGIAVLVLGMSLGTPFMALENGCRVDPNGLCAPGAPGK